ncbi:MAG: phenylalanine--tRNA ligase subunit beta [Nitrospinota bacterium]|nr:phenylalanine--tRNA ligase subunit beta [Nitrospinota bacterium]
MLIQLDWLKQYIDFDHSTEEIGSHLSMRGLEMEGVEWVELPNGNRTEVMELNVTPNRGYCLSHIGVAREVAALLSGTAFLPNIPEPKPGGIPVDERIKVINEAPELCPRYAVMVIENVNPGPSPQWLQDRLHAVGLRTINNIVDVTNFVLMEYGQPLHAFDHSQLAGDTIIIRRAGKNEAFESLMGDQLKLNFEDLVIADSEKPVALAGVMGGANSEVTESTRTVALESAFFDPVSVRRTSRKYGMSTDSSYRFERCVDIETVIAAQSRAAQLIQELAGGIICHGRMDIYPKPYTRQAIRLRTDRVRKILGRALTPQRIATILGRLQLEVKEQIPGEEFLVTVPHSRPTLKREIDLIEEIARLNGFENIPAGSPVVTVSPVNPQPRQAATRKIKEALSHLGYSEVVNYSFIEDSLASQFKTVLEPKEMAPIVLSNPISSDMETMRTSLLPRLLKTAARNINKGQKPVKIFEMGNIFLQSTEEHVSKEKASLAGLVCGDYEHDVWKQQGDKYNFFDLKGILESVLAQFKLTPTYRKSYQPFFLPGKSLDCYLQEERIGLLGEINPKTVESWEAEAKAYVFEIDLDELVKLLPDKVRFVPISRYPETYRDISILVDKTVASKTISDLIVEAGSPIIGRVELYDYFEGKKLPRGKKSLTFALAFQSAGKTLTDEEVNPVFDHIIAVLHEKQGAILRES